MLAGGWHKFCSNFIPAEKCQLIGMTAAGGWHEFCSNLNPHWNIVCLHRVLMGVGANKLHAEEASGSCAKSLTMNKMSNVIVTTGLPIEWTDGSRRLVPVLLAPQPIDAWCIQDCMQRDAN